MKLADFQRVVVMAVDRRYPSYSNEVCRLLRSKGCGPELFLNGRGVEGLDLAAYSLVHEDEPHSTWTYPRAAWDYWQAYKAVVSRALEDGVETLLIVEDDIELTPEFDAVCLRAEVPFDCQILYLGPMLYWTTTPPEPAGPYVVRLHGCEGFQAVGYRRPAMRALLALEVDRPIDSQAADELHPVLPAYGLQPAVVRQREGVTSVIAPGEPFVASFIYEVKR